MILQPNKSPLKSLTLASRELRDPSVSAVNPNTATTINAGASLVVTYTISGTPAAAGTLTGTFSKQGLNCTSTVTVTNQIASLIVRELLTMVL